MRCICSSKHQRDAIILRHAIVRTITLLYTHVFLRMLFIFIFTFNFPLQYAATGVRLEYSENYGLVWRSLPKECFPGEETDCYAFQLHSELLSRATGYRRTITLPIPVNKK